MRHIVLISGKDSLAVALALRERAPRDDYEYVWNEVGWDLPESYEWIDKVAMLLGKEIYRCGDDLTAITEEQGWLPTRVRRFCTRLAKIKPLNDYLGRSECKIYFGLRADEPDRVGYDPPQYQTPVYPLREYGMGIGEVWQICQKYELLPPAFHWEWLYQRVLERLKQQGAEHLLDKLRPWQRQALFAWRSRNNCDRCFNMRLYEKVGLLEHHPDRFWSAVEQEERLGADRGSGTTITWSKGHTWRSLVERAEAIREARAKVVSNYILGTWQKAFDFGDEEGFVDILEVTSCGLLCGK